MPWSLYLDLNHPGVKFIHYHLLNRRNWMHSWRRTWRLAGSDPLNLPCHLCKGTLLLTHFSDRISPPHDSRYMLYIIFIKFFLPIIPTFRFRSRPYFISYWLFFHMLHFLHLYLFPVSSVFLMFPTFTCAPIHPSTCFHFFFHVLWLCSRPFPSYYDILYFYVLSSLRSWLIPTQYINWCIFLVVLQFVNWR